MARFWYSLPIGLVIFALLFLLVIKSSNGQNVIIKFMLFSSFAIALMGATLNKVVMGFNGEKMPVNVENQSEEVKTVMEEYFELEDDARHAKFSSETRFPVLVDDIYVPLSDVGFAIISIGDVLFFAGAGGLFAAYGVIVVRAVITLLLTKIF